MIDRITYTAYLYLLLALSTNLPRTHAYFSLMAREIRPNWFKSFNYFFTSVELNEREPDVCYQTIGRSVWCDIEWVAFYNKPDETPISSVGLYNNRRCGNTNTNRRRRPQKMPMAVLVFDPQNLHGIHLVNLKALGIHWNRGAFVSLNLTEEVKQETRNGSTGVFSRIPGVPTHGVYVWEGDPANPKNLGRNVVYLPDTVQHVAEPTDLLQRMDVGSDRFGYVYMRDLIERALVGPERAAQIPDTVTPWLEAKLAGAWDGKKNGKMPPFRGPLYDAAADPKVFKSNKQAWEVERKPLETGLKKGRNGRSISYPIITPGVVDGMVYYQREVVDPVLSAGQNGVPVDEDEDEEDEGDLDPDDVSVNSRVIRELNDFLAASEEESRPDDAAATNGDGDEITEIQYTKEPVAEDTQEEEASVYEVYPEALSATEQLLDAAQLVNIQETQPPDDLDISQVVEQSNDIGIQGLGATGDISFMRPPSSEEPDSDRGRSTTSTRRRLRISNGMEDAFEDPYTTSSRQPLNQQALNALLEQQDDAPESLSFNQYLEGFTSGRRQRNQ